MLLGDPIKAQVRERYLGKGYSSNYKMMMGADFVLKEMKIQGRSIKFQFWDLTHHPHSGKSNSVLYYGSLGAMIFYKIGDRNSFEDVRPWLKELKEHNGRGSHIPVVLIGIQEDLGREKITNEEIHALIQEVQSPVFPISDYIISKGEESETITKILQDQGEIYLNFIESFKAHKKIPLLSYAEIKITDFYSTLAQQTDTVAHQIVQKIDSHRTHQYSDGDPFAYAFTIRELEYLIEIYQNNNPNMADSITDSIEMLKSH